MRKLIRCFLCVAFGIVLLGTVGLTTPAIAKDELPNIVFILCDDLGYGDLRCCNPDGKIATPHADRIAAQGMRFTDAHSGSSVCTPTRYGLLTGRYSWRSRLQNGVLGGMSPPLIAAERLTLPALLRQHGYHTACIGKWHLGLDWSLKEGAKPFDDNIEKGEDGWRVDFAREFRQGPIARGFDEYFGISASLDMVPYTFLAQDRVTVVPTVDKAFPMMLGKSGRDTRRGPAAAAFEADQVLPELTKQATDYIRRRAPAARSGQPFFLYLPLASPHTPTVPTAAWQSKSGLNAYGDFVMQTDSALGQIMEALAEHELTDRTLVVFTSDNGCSPEADFPALKKQGHNPSFRFRGHKADIYEGGHRIPMLVRWPGRVAANSTSEHLVCLVDWLATSAELVQAKLPDDAGEDSVSLLPVLLGKPNPPVREALVHHSINGSFAIRQGPWKLCLCDDSGGWSEPRPGAKQPPETPSVQLFHLAHDLGETKNVQAEHPEIVDRLTGLLENYVAQGRSTPGLKQTNDVPIKIRK